MSTAVLPNCDCCRTRRTCSDCLLFYLQFRLLQPCFLAGETERLSTFTFFNSHTCRLTLMWGCDALCPHMGGHFINNISVLSANWAKACLTKSMLTLHKCLSSVWDHRNVACHVCFVFYCFMEVTEKETNVNEPTTLMRSEESHGSH